MYLLVAEAEVVAGTLAVAAATMAGDIFYHLLSVVLKISLQLNPYDTEASLLSVTQ